MQFYARNRQNACQIGPDPDDHKGPALSRLIYGRANSHTRGTNAMVVIPRVQVAYLPSVCGVANPPTMTGFTTVRRVPVPLGIRTAVSL